MARVSTSKSSKLYQTSQIFVTSNVIKLSLIPFQLVTLVLSFDQSLERSDFLLQIYLDRSTWQCQTEVTEILSRAIWGECMIQNQWAEPRQYRWENRRLLYHTLAGEPKSAADHCSLHIPNYEQRVCAPHSVHHQFKSSPKDMMSKHISNSNTDSSIGTRSRPSSPAQTSDISTSV